MCPSDHILVRTPAGPDQYFTDLELAVRGPDWRQGIMPWIANYGDLYHVRLTRACWVEKFLEIKKQLLSDMLGKLTDPDVIENVDFKLEMIADAMNLDAWQLPGIMNLFSNRLQWATGHSRLLAGGLNWSDPWNRMHHLLFVPYGENFQSLQHRFAHLEKIESDAALRLSFAGAVDNEHTLTMHAKFLVDQHRTALFLQSITTTKVHAKKHNDRSKVAMWKQWRACYLDKPLSVKIRCMDINKITDSSGSWRLHHIGTPPQDLISPAQMSMHIFKQKQTLAENDCCDLYLFDSARLDLADLFFQVDTDHTVFHSADWNLIFVQPGLGFKCREISQSRC